MSQGEVLFEGKLSFRREKEKWIKVNARILVMGKLHAVKLTTVSKKESDATVIDTITITKELVVIGPVPEKDKAQFHLANGRKEVHFLAKLSVVNEWINKINEIADTKRDPNDRVSQHHDSPSKSPPPTSPPEKSKSTKRRSAKSVLRPFLKKAKRDRSVSLDTHDRANNESVSNSPGLSTPPKSRMRGQHHVRTKVLLADAQYLVKEGHNKFDEIESTPVYESTQEFEYADISELSASEELKIDIKPSTTISSSPPSAPPPPSTSDSPDSSNKLKSSSGGWTPALSKDKMEEIKKSDEMRQKIALEIFNTEKSYIEALEFTITHYKQNLLKKAEHMNVEQDSVSKIFGTIDVLCGFNKKLYLEISKVMAEWTPQSTLGPLFKKFIPFLKMYTEYSNKFPVSSQLLAQLSQNSESFREELKSLVESNPSRADLASYLIQPIQRIPRYNLLLKELQKNTPEDHADYTVLEECLAKIGEVASHINEEIRRYENSRRVEESKNITGLDMTIFIAPHRSFLKDGLAKVHVEIIGHKDKKSYDQFLILFSDLFVHVKKDLMKNDKLDLTKPQYTWPLELVWLDDSDSKKIKILGPTERLSFPNKDDWSNAIRKALEERIKLKNKNAVKKRESNEIVRYGEYVYPDNQGAYKGMWSEGKREGRGNFSYLGTSYKGYWKDDKMEGKGKMVYLNGDIYLGYWSEGRPHNKGKLLMVDTSKFIGEFEHGVRSGHGKIEYEGGNVFNGIWKKDKAIEGEFKCTNGHRYRGGWQDNLYHGLGQLTMTDDSVYEGEFVAGRRHGRGKMQYTPGVYYQGQWENDMRHGKGILVDSEKSRYIGKWANDRPHGFGRREYADGTVYQGDWEDGSRTGKGKCAFPRDAYYDGDWKHDRFHGEGEYREEDGVVYKGNWIYGTKQGKGQYIFPSGARYVGYVNNGKFHKTGKFEGEVGDMIQSYDGEWSNGRIHGKGTLTFENGDVYEGGFNNNNYHGEGTYRFANGTILDTKWDMGSIVGKVAYKQNRDGGTPAVPLYGTLTSTNMLNPSSSCPIQTIIHFTPIQPFIFINSVLMHSQRSTV
eukprot:TRINITY_DN6074_c0_g2_i1.p1 TRINITY_DN6074_c0_g2~~TRINITY_DN6074_c0_g2_i1.p1  ORF type:complete len:1111 (-),score=275.22 TRINITY_DN6074_c0_g2_i1:73-3264(-)